MNFESELKFEQQGAYMQIVDLKNQYGDGNMGTEAEQQMLLKIDMVHTPWPMIHT